MNRALQRIATGMAAALTLSAGAVVAAGAPAHASVYSCDESNYGMGSNMDFPTPYDGGEAPEMFTDEWNRRPQGTMTWRWSKFKCSNYTSNPLIDVWGMTVATQWQLDGGDAAIPATMYQEIQSDTPAVGTWDATPSYTSQTDCSTPIPVGLNLWVLSVGGTIQACNSYGVTRSASNDYGAQWTSDYAGELSDVETTFIEAVPKGVVPKFDISFGSPQFYGTDIGPQPGALCDCDMTSVLYDEYWTDIYDPGNYDTTTVSTVSTGGSGGGSGSGSGSGSTISTPPVSFQANTGFLYTYDSPPGGTYTQGTHIPYGLMPGTSPAIASNGSSWEIAFQANTGYLYTYDPVTGAHNTGYGMKAGTSPAITALSNGTYEVAFQANTGFLYTYTASGATYIPYGMMAGTSPAIAALSNGSYEVAFQANTGFLYTYAPSSGATYIPYGMMAGTSPAIASNGSSWEIAFQANTGYLYTYTPSGGAIYRPYGMMAATSPAIAALADGSYEVAFQANTGFLYTFSSSAGATYRPYGMMSGTSPAIAATSSGWKIAFQANTGFLYTYTSSGQATNTEYGMMAKTSPSI